MPKFFCSPSYFLIFIFLLSSSSFAQTKGKENYIFNHTDRLKKQTGIRLKDSAKVIIFVNSKLGYTEIYQKNKSYWFLKDQNNILLIDKSNEDTLMVETADFLSLDKSATYQWVMGEGVHDGYFFRKGQIVLSVQTVNKGKRTFVKMNFNERDANKELLKIAALYKAHHFLTLNNKPSEGKEEEYPLD